MSNYSNILYYQGSRLTFESSGTAPDSVALNM